MTIKKEKRLLEFKCARCEVWSASCQSTECARGKYDFWHLASLAETKKKESGRESRDARINESGRKRDIRACAY